MTPPPPGLDLGGTWRATGADDGLRRTFPAMDFDDRAWAEIAVPGHWRSTAAFAGHDGPLLHRRRFESEPAPDRRRWLVLDGVFYQGDVWLDGSYVGDTEGYFSPHAFDVTEALASGREHVLAVEVTCSRPRDRSAKRNITGSFQDGEGIDPEWNPGGIWRPIRIEETGPVRVDRLRVTCPEATGQRAVVQFRATLDAAEGGPATVATTVGGLDHEAEHTLAQGRNTVAWTVTVDDPELWWPRVLGGQPLHDVSVEVLVGGRPSHRRQLRTGLREIRMRKWQLTVNGERLFVKGACQPPARPDLAMATGDDLERDVRLALDTGLDLLRVHAHVSRPELYDAADRHGLLLWQDFPLRRGHARGIRKQAVRQAVDAVDLLAHHPSVAIWCGHDEPLATPIDPGEVPTRKRLRRFVEQELPTWNKTLLDGSVKRAFERADGSRPVVAHSGVLPHPGSGGTDSHAYIGWHEGEIGDFAGFFARIPRLARFVGEFGAQALPDDAAFCRPEDWPDLDWDRLRERFGMQVDCFRRHVAPADHDTFESWQAATQAHQAGLLRHHIEVLRTLKYRPTGGFAFFGLADPAPSVGFGVVDHDRRPKAALDAVRAACAPVIVVAAPDDAYDPASDIAVDVHVVSDLRHTVSAAVVEARLSWDGGEFVRRWTGDVVADSCVRIGTLQVMAPASSGPLRLDLTLDGDGVRATNSYTSEVTAR